MKRGIHRTTFALILILSFSSLNICRANGVYPKHYADTVYIYGDMYNPPYEKLSEDGKPEGYTIETIREVMHKLNLPYKIQLVERKDMRSKLNSHRHVLLLGAASQGLQLDAATWPAWSMLAGGLYLVLRR